MLFPALWKVTPLVAAWFGHEHNPLYGTVINSSTNILELGTGVAGMIAVTLAPRIKHYYASDQEYCLKILQKNIDTNSNIPHDSSRKKSTGKNKHSKNQEETLISSRNISVIELDWETTSVKHIPELQSCILDVVIACDCIYNENLIPSFIEALVDACSLGMDNEEHSRNGSEQEKRPTLALIAQELRSFDVMEPFMAAFCEQFQVARIPDHMYKDLGVDDLKEGGGFVIHVGILKSDIV